MKTAICYYSHHHGNTLKVLRAIAQGQDITLIDAAGCTTAQLGGYDAVGLASGIYYGKFHPSVTGLAGQLQKGQRVFFVYTCGSLSNRYTKEIAGIAAGRGAHILGEYGCRGFDTFGPFKLLGGIAKGHPDAQELEKAKEFYASIGNR